MESSANLQLSQRIKADRTMRGWTLDQFAERSGVSRAMISKIERGEVSPTAAILARLASGLGVSLATLFSDDTQGGEPLSRAKDQTVWTDPETGYERRNVSSPGAAGAAEIVDVVFPAGGRIVFDNMRERSSLSQQIWIIEGIMEMTVGGETTHLEKGDCLFMRLDQPLVFHNPSDRPARYAAVISRQQL